MDHLWNGFSSTKNPVNDHQYYSDNDSESDCPVQNETSTDNEEVGFFEDFTY